MNTILDRRRRLGERARATPIAFGGRIDRRLRRAGHRAPAPSPTPARTATPRLRDAALDTAHAMSRKLEGVPRDRCRSARPPGLAARRACTSSPSVDAGRRSSSSARPTPAASAASCPGSTGEKLAARRAVRGRDRPARLRRAARSRRIGVAYDGSDEAEGRARLRGRASPSAFGAELELIGVAASDWYTGPALARRASASTTLRAGDRAATCASSLERGGARASASAATTDPAHAATRADELAERSAHARPARHRLARLRPAAQRHHRRRQRPR